jgi:hypothetical protein
MTTQMTDKLVAATSALDLPLLDDLTVAAQSSFDDDKEEDGKDNHGTKLEHNPRNHNMRARRRITRRSLRISRRSLGTADGLDDEGDYVCRAEDVEVGVWTDR